MLFLVQTGSHSRSAGFRASLWIRGANRNSRFTTDIFTASRLPMQNEPPTQHSFFTQAVAFACLGSLAVSSCTSIVSTQGTSRKGDVERGVPYCLPMGKVSIRIVRGPGRSPAADAAAASPQQPANGGAGRTAGAAMGRAERRSAVRRHANSGGSDALSLPVGRGDLFAQNEGDNPNLVLPKIPPVLQVNPAGTGDNRQDDSAYWIQYIGTEYVPDRSKQFVARHTPNAMADDEIEIRVGKDSLLVSVDVKSYDRSVDVAKKLVEIGKNVARILAQSETAKWAQGSTIIMYEGSFDPLHGGDLAQINRELRKVEGGPYSVEIIGRTGSGKSRGDMETVPKDKEGRFSGIAFRPAGSYDLVLKRRGVTQVVKSVVLPNEMETCYMPINRSSFVKRVHKLEFESGMLVKATLNKPSEVLAAVEIPLEISKALVALPGEIVADNVTKLRNKDSLLTQKAANSRSERALLDEEISNINKTIELREAQKKLKSLDGSGQPVPQTVR